MSRDCHSRLAFAPGDDLTLPSLRAESSAAAKEQPEPFYFYASLEIPLR